MRGRVSQHNISQLPTLLMTALLNAASNGEHDEEKARSYGFEPSCFESKSGITLH
jgi:hypothetical protein